ncbi:MAG: AAA family ATPase [Magnetospirillum sp.]|nr:AAA family ATPase [Magnetospirillum sp.]
MGRPTVITVFNQKGGVGKTTTSVNIAICLAAFGKRVALIDLDSQSNATTNLGVTPPVATGAYHLITERVPFSECLRKTPYDGVLLVGGSDELAWTDIELALKPNPEAGLTRAFEAMPPNMDFIVIDCPPAPGVVSVNALVAADVVLMPVMPSPHALDGLHKAWWNVNRVRTHFNRDMHTVNILLTMTEDGDLTKRLSEDIIAEFGSRVMPVLVPRDNVVIEAAARDLPIAVLATGSPPTRAYLRVADLLLARTHHMTADAPRDGAPDREEALAQLEEWRNAVGNLPAHAPQQPRNAEQAPAPVPGWAAEDGEDAPAQPSAWGWKLGVALMLIVLGAVLGFAVAMAVLNGSDVTLPA